MKTLVVYDNSGNIFSQISGSYLLPQGGIQYVEVEVPEGKKIVGVDVSATPHQVILEDIPKTEMELLKEENVKIKESMAELAELILGGM